MGAIAAAPTSRARLDLLPLRVERAGGWRLFRLTQLVRVHRWFAAHGRSLAGAVRADDRGSTNPDVSFCNWVIRLRESGLLAGAAQATIFARGAPTAAGP
jgi:hypothetical protein